MSREWKGGEKKNMTGKTHIAISAASVTVYMLAAGVRITHCPVYLQALFRNEQGTPLSRIDCTEVYGAAALFILGVSAGLFPDLDADGASLERLPARAGEYLDRRRPPFRSLRQSRGHKGAN